LPFLVLVLIPILLLALNITHQDFLYYVQYRTTKNITDETTLEAYDHLPIYNSLFTEGISSYYPYSLVLLHFQGRFECMQMSNMSSIICGDHKVITNATISDTYRVGIFLPIPFLGICLLYGLYPLKCHANDYFRKKGDRNAINEYTFVKNILYIGIPMMVFLSSIYYIGLSNTVSPSSFLLGNIVYFSQVSLQYSITAGALWMLSHMIRKEFRYYLAKAYINGILDSDDNTKKMHLLIKAVNSYNKYLMRFLKLQIDTLRVYSTLVVDSKVPISDHIISLSESFDDNDKFMPARRICQIMNAQNAEEFFAKQSLGTRIVTWGTLVATILPLLISIFQLLTQSPKH
jgi:hypothetical protein